MRFDPLIFLFYLFSPKKQRNAKSPPEGGLFAVSGENPRSAVLRKKAPRFYALPSAPHPSRLTPCRLPLKGKAGEGRRFTALRGKA
jgi:hypothetical protein